MIEPLQELREMQERLRLAIEDREAARLRVAMLRRQIEIKRNAVRDGERQERIARHAARQKLMRIPSPRLGAVSPDETIGPSPATLAPRFYGGTQPRAGR